MKVLSAISAYPPSTGGAQLHAHQLNLALTERGHEVEVATLWRTNRRDWLRGSTFAAPPPRQSTELDGIPIHIVGLPPVKRPVAGLKGAMYYPAMSMTRPLLSELYRDRWRNLIDAVEPDIVHLSRIGREWWYQGLIDVLREHDIPYVLTPNHHPHWGSRRRDGWWNDIYRDAGAILALSDHEANAITTLDVDSQRVLRTVVACTGTPPLGRSNEHTRHNVLFLGQVRKYKGLDPLYRALLERVWPQHGDVRLVVVGPWIDEQRRLRSRLDADTRVDVLGPVTEETKWEQLQSAAVLCVPSTEEALGGVYVEAWNVGCPAIGANIPTVKELFERTGAGLAVEPTPRGIGEALLRVLTDTELAARMTAAGQRAVVDEFNWPTAASRALKAYQLALN